MSAAKQFWQLAWVVDDIDSAVRQWRRTAGIGPFFVGRHVGAIIGDAEYRGAPFTVDMSCAIAQAGPVQIELIQQHGAAPSPYRDAVAEGTEGFHHICSFVEDVPAECRDYEQNGFDVVMTGSVGGSRVAYIDTRPMLGCMTEVMQPGGLVGQLNQAVAAAANGWDGTTDPVRDFAALMG